MEFSEEEEGPFSAGAYYSRDFEWEALRQEVESSPGFLSLDRNQKPASVSGSSSDLSSESRAWQAFHTRHSKKLFFKERRYLVKEFPELLQGASCILEIGCGTGSSVVSILRANPRVTMFACDCSEAALTKASEIVSSLSAESRAQFYPFLCDVAHESFPFWLLCSSCKTTGFQSDDIRASKARVGREGGEVGISLELAPRCEEKPPLITHCCVGGVDIVMLIFTLSAIPVASMPHVLAKVLAVLKPGGYLLFRDYGLYDMTMLRFAPFQRISHEAGVPLYQRDDGTLCYYFSVKTLRELLTTTGFVEEELEYCCVKLINRRKQMPMKRVWVHAKFRKPFATI
ncbi:unnamed protein product [Sphagnum compactum]